MEVVLRNRNVTWKEHTSRAFALNVVVLLPEIKTVENYYNCCLRLCDVVIELNQITHN